jgi:hypothetical protein
MSSGSLERQGPGLIPGSELNGLGAPQANCLTLAHILKRLASWVCKGIWGTIWRCQVLLPQAGSQIARQIHSQTWLDSRKTPICIMDTSSVKESKFYLTAIYIQYLT